MKHLYLGAMANADPDAMAYLRERLPQDFGLPLREFEPPLPDSAYDEKRDQWGSIPVLASLLPALPADALKLLAVTEKDLFIPALTFVYGQAQLGGQVAVVSLARLRQEFYGLPPSRELLLLRAYKEALHELGHTFGLTHCADGNCAMALATNIRQIDLKRASFCAPCAARLRRRPRE